MKSNAENKNIRHNLVREAEIWTAYSVQRIFDISIPDKQYFLC